MAHWLFQANAEYFDLEKAIDGLDKIAWIVSRYTKEIKVGDTVAIWKSGRRAGIFAFGHIESFYNASRSRPNSQYWLDDSDWIFVGKTHAVIAIDEKLVQCPLLKPAIVADPIFANFSVVRAPIGTNFRVSDEEWRRLRHLARANKKRADDRASKMAQQSLEAAALLKEA